MSSIILDSLKSLYIDKPDVLQLLHQLDLTTLEKEFYKILYEHISPQEFERVDKFLRSEECRRYNDALSLATYELIDSLEDITKVIELPKPTNKQEIN